MGTSDVSLDMAAPGVVHGAAWRLVAALIVFLLVAPPLYVILAFSRPEIAVPVTAGVIVPVITWLYTKGWGDSSAIFNDLGERDTLLRLVRWGSFIWLLYGFLDCLVQLVPTTGAPVRLAASVAFLLGVVQLTLLGFILERWARWTRDDMAEGLARFVAFAMAIILVGTLGGIVVQFFYRPSADLMSAVSGLVMLAVALGFLILAVRLGSNGVMSVYHLHLNRRMDQRREERRAAHEEEMAARSARIDPDER